MGQIVLVVDDDLDTRAAIAEFLRAEAFTVELAADGDEALKRLQDGLSPCAIVLDVSMRRLNGVQFLDQTAALRPPSCKIIVMTALPRYEHVRTRADVAHVLPKPFEPEALLKLLQPCCI